MDTFEYFKKYFHRYIRSTKRATYESEIFFLPVTLADKRRPSILIVIIQ